MSEGQSLNATTDAALNDGQLREAVQFALAQASKHGASDAEAAASLSHSGIVAIHEVGQCEGVHYFSMQYIDGETLAQRLRKGPIPPVEAATILRKIAQAVSYAHQRGVIHRDLKPANLLLANDDTVKLVDFGIVKVFGTSEHTAPGSVLGTADYMPPEQLGKLGKRQARRRAAAG